MSGTKSDLQPEAHPPGPVRAYGGLVLEYPSAIVLVVLQTVGLIFQTIF